MRYNELDGSIQFDSVSVGGATSAETLARDARKPERCFRSQHWSPPSYTYNNLKPDTLIFDEERSSVLSAIMVAPYKYSRSALSPMEGTVILYLVRHYLTHLLKEKEGARGSSVYIPVLDCLRFVGPEKLDERPAATVLPHLRIRGNNKL